MNIYMPGNEAFCRVNSAGGLFCTAKGGICMFIIDSIISGMMAIADVIWGWPILILTSFVAVYMTVRLRFFQFRHFGLIMKETFGKIFDKGSGEGNINPFKAACTALASTLGVGNIAGVSVAIATGGPGAVFWMWFIAMLGLIVKFSEVTLAVAYREKDPDTGEWHGGFPWFVKNGLGKKWKWLSLIWTVTLGLGMMVGPAVQSNAIAQSLSGSFGISPLYIGIAVAVLMGLVLVGGLKSLSNFANAVVPFMAIIYIAVSVVVMIVNASAIPAAFAMIFHDAFTGTAASGGFLGSSVMLGIRWGLARGIFSNEAGTGTAPLVHSSAAVNHPVKQGLWGIFEVFFDTIVVCTMTAMVVMTSGLWNTGISGAALTTAGFSTAFGSVAAGAVFVSVIITFFAFTTCVVNVYYGGICLNSLGLEGVWIKIYYAVGCAWAIVGAIGAAKTLWSSFDFFYGTCVVCNLIVVFLLSGKVKILVDDYKQRLKDGKWDESAADCVARLGIWRDEVTLNMEKEAKNK